MMDAMNGRDGVIQKQLKTEQKVRDKQKELDKMTLGKTTLKSFFKTKSGVEKDILNYQADIEAMNVDVEDYRKLINFVTITTASWPSTSSRRPSCSSTRRCSTSSLYAR